MNSMIKLLFPFAALCLLLSAPLLAEEEEHNPNQASLIKRMKGIIIPELSFDDLDFYEAVDSMRKISDDINLVIVPHRGMHHLDVTLKLRNISYFNALEYLLLVCGLEMRVDDHAVVILPGEDWHDDDDDCDDDDDDDDDDDWF